MIVNVKRGPAATDLEIFIRDVMYLPGMGKKNATAAFLNAGTLFQLNIPAEKIDTATRNLRRLALDGTLIVEGLPGIEPKETEPMPATHSTPAPNATPVATQDDLAILRRLLSSGVTEERVLELIAASAGLWWGREVIPLPGAFPEF